MGHSDSDSVLGAGQLALKGARKQYQSTAESISP